jgi:uncharacterized protein YlxW (UPF0749 family)
MPRHILMVLSLVAAVLGFLITQQIRTVGFITKTAQMQQGQLLTALVTRAEQHNLAMRQQVNQLESRLAAFGQPDNVQGLKADLNRVEPLAALTPVSGSGVEVVMHDATKPAFPNEPAMLRLVHDQYVLRVVALLSAAGAQAISIDGQRYTATTSIFCAGPTIRINGVPYASPYVIRAVGPSGPMLKALENDTDIQGWSQLVSIKYRSMKHLEIAPYRGRIAFSEAKPAKIGG